MSIETITIEPPEGMVHLDPSIEVTFEYTPSWFRPAITHRAPEDCSPAEAGEAEFELKLIVLSYGDPNNPYHVRRVPESGIGMLIASYKGLYEVIDNALDSFDEDFEFDGDNDVVKYQNIWR